MKPSSLEPYVPYNLPLYWGPDPAAGISYGSYENDAKSIVVTKKQDKVFCPVTGRQMTFVGDIEVVDFEQAKAEILSKHSVSCSCGQSSYANFDVSEEELFCWNCGNSLGEKKTMSKARETRKAIEAKLAKASETEEFVNIDQLLTELDEEEANKPAETEPEEGETPEPVSEEGVEAPSEEAPAEEVSEAPAPESTEAPMTEEVSEAPESTEAPAEEELTDADLEDVEEVAEEVAQEVADEITEKLQDQIDELKEDEQDEQEMIDLDIVLSMLNEENMKNKENTAVAEEMIDLTEVIEMAKQEIGKSVSCDEEAVAKEEMIDISEVVAMAKQEVAKKAEAKMKSEKQKTIARIRAKSRARLLQKRVKAELEAKKAQAEAPVLEDLPTVKVPAEQKEHKVKEVPATDVKKAAEEAPANVELSNVRELEDAEGKKLMEEVATEPSEALRYEAVASFDSLASITKDDVEMVLFAEKSENPTWVVFAKTLPVAKIELASQEHADIIRPSFVEADYATDFINATAQDGLLNTLKTANAHFYANHISDKAIADRYEAKAQEKIEAFKAQAETKLRSDLMGALDVVTVGMNKNLYKDVGHPLKEALYESMVLAGMPENTAESVIDSSFAAASSEYYQVVFEKAIAFMNMSDTAKSEVKAMISEANVMQASEDMEPATLEERLGRASSVASLTGGYKPSLQVESSIKIDKDSYKARLKSVISK